MDKDYDTLKEATHSLQALLLEKIKRMEIEVGIFLHSGIKLTGRIIDFDDSIILLQNSGKQHTHGVQLIYKHAISTVSVIDSSMIQFLPVEQKNQDKIHEQIKLN